ncbi:hypothetical protein AB0I28_23250 [Phytomonospora sp. NPDC050363]|uniref:hypothetical protein n=1 Tax=Phytomonospora sp. NPDC050363 TaxID=3155642 RepID=UPI0033F66F90
MTTSEPQGLLDVLTAAARTAAEALDGRNLRIGPGGRVHAVGTVRWLGGVEAPGPRCHIGTTAGPVAGVIPTREPVDCARCLKALDDGAGGPGLDGAPTLPGL